MIETIVIVAVAVFAISTLSAYRSEREKRTGAWQKVANDLRLSLSRPGWSSLRLEGPVTRFRLAVEETSEPEPVTRFRISNTDIPRGVALVRERVWKTVMEGPDLVPGADSGTVMDIARALEQIGDSAAESALLSLLARDEIETKVVVAEALRRVGTVAAVEPLLEYTKGFGETDLKRAAQNAIDSIQFRLGDVGAGRLAIADVSHEEGRLSLSDKDTRGRVSVSDSDES